jgi:hypothetical protein
MRPAPTSRSAAGASARVGTARQGLTLLEILVSTTLALIMASLCVGAYLQSRAAILAAEVRLTMNDRAQALYHALYRDCQSVMPQCAMVVQMSPGGISWICMRGKEDSYDYNPAQNTYATDLVWLQWQWQNQALSRGTSTPERSFTASKAVSLHGIALQGETFINLPQPRRFLDPTTPLLTLDDNAYFPSAGAGSVSQADPLGDIGDATDLAQRLTTAAPGVTMLSLQLVFHDGTTQTFDGTGAATVVIPGVWLDGRLAPRLSDLPDYAHSPVVGRPESLRLLMTLTDRGTGISQTYSFSFALPGLSPVSEGS